MTADAARRASRGEENDGVAQELDIVLERCALRLGEFRLGRVEDEPGQEE